MLGSALQYENLVRQARALYLQRNHVDARHACTHLLKLKKNSPEALLLLAEIDWQESRRDEAIDQLRRYLRIYPKDVRAAGVLGDWLRTEGRGEESAAVLEKLNRSQPNNPLTIAALARTYMSLNESEKAKQLLLQSIDTPNEHPVSARVYVALQNNLKNYDEAIRVGLRHANNPNMPAEARTEILILLGQSYEKIGDYDSAFEAYRVANKINPPEYDPEETYQHVRELMQIFTRERLKKMPRATTESEKAIFVVSRPRSGSTMLERILASHPDTAAAGEATILSLMAENLPLSIGTTSPYPSAVLDLDQKDVNRLSQEYLDFLKSIDPTAKRITNKYLSNWKLLGFIQLLLPNARVLDLRRDPIDNGLACFASMLGTRHPASYDLRHIGLSYCAEIALIEHWKSVLDLPILTVNYEDIVSDQELWTRKVLDFCGLEFHEDTLRFHEAGEKKQISTSPTLSYNQVRQPIYKTSVGRAEKFGKHIEPLLEGLEEGRKLWGLKE